MSLNLPLLPAAPIIEGSGAPTVQFQQWWQTTVGAISKNVDDIAAALAQAVDALNAAIAAQNAAIDALNAAVTAQTTADGAQATADGKLDQATADVRYVRQDQTAVWTAPTGTVSRSGFASYSGATAGASYSQTDTQAVMDATRDVSRALAALVQDLKANNTLA